ncbi:hypothetical protein SEA_PAULODIABOLI_347 [Microbacterium phage PauloDiaboli]|nr:hypothetical protein SEA_PAULODIABOLI_347 [Microbacterium phage PauloDiaboli]
MRVQSDTWGTSVAESVVHYIGEDTITECGSDDEGVTIALQTSGVTCRACIDSLRNGEWIS